MNGSVLVVDDNRSAAEALGLVLQRHGYDVAVVFDGAAAMARLSAGGVDVVITDLRMEGPDGLDVLRHARRLPQPAEVVVLTGYGTIEAAVAAMRLGARDFLTKPATPAQVIALLQQLKGDGPRLRVLEGRSAAAARLRRQVEAVLASDAPVLLLGEPGTGRAELARLLHERGARSKLNFVVVNSARALAEIDPGTTGTVSLPAVDLLDPRDHGELVRGLDALGPGTRVIASAGGDWSERKAATPSGRELFFRVAVLELHLPPLRERREDIGELLRARLADRARGDSTGAPVPTSEQLTILESHGWPGNLRELSALVERALVFGADAWNIHVQAPPAPTDPIPQLVEGFSLQDHLERVEKAILERAIAQTGMDRNEMSRLLNVERNTLRYKLNKYGLLER